jgi:hypothetical protein
VHCVGPRWRGSRRTVGRTPQYYFVPVRPPDLPRSEPPRRRADFHRRDATRLRHEPRKVHEGALRQRRRDP